MLGELLTVDSASAGRDVWRIDLENLAASTLRGVLPTGFDQPFNLAGLRTGEVLGVDNASPKDLWQIDPDMPSNEASPFGLIGALVSGIGNPQGLTETPAGAVLLLNNDDIWRIDPSDPDSQTAPYGLIGSIPSAFSGGSGLAAASNTLGYAIGQTNDEIWSVDLETPSNSARIGSLPLNSGEAPTGIVVLAGGTVVVSTAQPRFLFVDTSDPSASTFVAGTVPSGLSQPAGLAIRHLPLSGLLVM